VKIVNNQSNTGKNLQNNCFGISISTFFIEKILICLNQLFFLFFIFFFSLIHDFPTYSQNPSISLNTHFHAAKPPPFEPPPSSAHFSINVGRLNPGGRDAPQQFRPFVRWRRDEFQAASEGSLFTSAEKRELVESVMEGKLSGGLMGFMHV
jgi:hypothetical protein